MANLPYHHYLLGIHVFVDLSWLKWSPQELAKVNGSSQALKSWLKSMAKVKPTTQWWYGKFAIEKWWTWAAKSRLIGFTCIGLHVSVFVHVSLSNQSWHDTCIGTHVSVYQNTDWLYVYRVICTCIGLHVSCIGLHVSACISLHVSACISNSILIGYTCIGLHVHVSCHDWLDKETCTRLCTRVHLFVHVSLSNQSWHDTCMGWLRSVASIYRSLLQNSVSCIGLFCKRDLWFYRSYELSP